VPELPLDTLFIVGLLIASFVGKILEGKAKKKKEVSKPKRTRPPREDSIPEGSDPQEKGLGELLREAFGEVIEPVHEEAPYEANLPEKEPARLPDLTTQIKPSSVIHANKEAAKKAPSVEQEFSARKWLRTEALGSTRSLRRSFLVKEVLDQPVGLRRTFF
jgi:hypothetical protein